MIKKIILGILIIILIFIAIKILSPDEKAKVKRDIKIFKNAVEQEKKSEALKYIDPEYHDIHGMSYEGFINNIDGMVTGYDSIRIHISNVRVRIDSVKAQYTYASCSLGLKIFARYEGERALIFGGIVKPSPVRAFFRRDNTNYRVYYAEY